MHRTIAENEVRSLRMTAPERPGPIPGFITNFRGWTGIEHVVQGIVSHGHALGVCPEGITVESAVLGIRIFVPVRVEVETLAEQNCVRRTIGDTRERCRLYGKGESAVTVAVT